ncbi:MAG: Co2+/Mg2+ efflux protein ApaG [Pseudomonadota bacterium]
MNKLEEPDMLANKVEIEAVTTYLAGHSRPEDDQYTFAYTITISNHSDQNVQLLSRHWIITDAENHVQEVRGDGVVGEQPIIEPGAYFRYTSGATLNTPVGRMEGTYFMIAPDDQEDDARNFEVAIPAFSLHTPTALH